MNHDPESNFASHHTDFSQELLPPLGGNSLDGSLQNGGAIERLGCDLVHEMRRRWCSGERVLAEEFLKRYPDLSQCAEVVIDLIYEEYCQRQLADEVGVEQDIVRRFPQWAGQLRVMLDCHRVLQSDVESPEFPSVGETIAGFRLLCELGHGSCGRVFLAKQTALADRPVVLKITPRDGGEHTSLARLQHTNIVPLYWVIDDAARSIRILCMPYFGRVTLASLLLQGARSRVRQATSAGTRDAIPHQSSYDSSHILSTRSGLDILKAIDREETLSCPAATAGAARQLLAHVSYVQAIGWIGACLADVLEFAHQRVVVHLDIKPSNVLLASDGQPMLLDFHLAREPIRPGSAPPQSLGGTPHYMPPEQEAAMRSLQNGRIVETPVDGRADIYALGAVLYESLGGRLPITPDSPPLASVNPQV